MGGDGSFDTFDGCVMGGVVERLDWRDACAEGGLCWSWRWPGGAVKTCMTDGTIGSDWALSVRCLSRGEGDISRGGEF